MIILINKNVLYQKLLIKKDKSVHLVDKYNKGSNKNNSFIKTKYFCTSS